MSYALTTTVDQPYESTVERVRNALGAQGFGILTEIDLQATLKAKLGVQVAPHVIFGACNPPLAHTAVQVDPSIGLLLPCNVVVREGPGTTTIVEAVDPKIMVALTGNAALQSVADDATRRLVAALDSLTEPPENWPPD